MFRLGGSRPQSPSYEAHELRPNQRYALIRIGSVEFAYTTRDGYLRALGQAWAAGFAPDPLPSVLGRDLPSTARALQGVDMDLGPLSPADPRPAPL